MFCTKCGFEYVNGILFCGQCGTPTTVEETFTPPKVLTKREYLNGACSKAAKTNQKVIRSLGIVSLAIQSISCLLSGIWLAGLIYGLASTFGAKAEVSALGPWLLFAIVLLGGTYLFTLLGIKKKSTGLLITAAFFAFFGTAFTAIYKEKLLVVIAILAFHIVMIVLNARNVKEYKSYVAQNKSVSARYI